MALIQASRVSAGGGPPPAPPSLCPGFVPFNLTDPFESGDVIYTINSFFPVLYPTIQVNYAQKILMLDIDFELNAISSTQVEIVILFEDDPSNYANGEIPVQINWISSDLECND